MQNVQSRSTFQTLLLIVALWMYVVTGAVAQPVATSSIQPSATAIAPIPLQDILTRADDEQQHVDRVNQLLALPDPVDQLRATLDDIAAPVDAKLRTTSGIVLNDLPIARLESLSRHWEFDARSFERWEAHARRTLYPYSASALQLAQRRAAWSATRAAGFLDGLPPVMSDRVDAMLADIDTSETALGTVLTRQFDLMQRASDLKARIQAGRNNVATAIDDIDHRLLQTDMPPLWQSLSLNGGTRAAIVEMERGLEIESQFAVDYRAAHTGNQQALAIVQVLLLPLIAWLVLRNRRTSQKGTQPRKITRALRRPISAWLLLSMLSVLVFEPDAPLLVEEFALLIALVPVLRLLPSGVLRSFGIWPYIAIALYVIDRVGLAVVADIGPYRLFLLLLNVLALGLTFRMLRRPLPSTSAKPDRNLQRAIRPLGGLVFLMLSVAAVCNIEGNISMAETLTSGVIDSGYMALLLYASVTVCIGIFRAVLSQPECANRRLVLQHGPVLHAAWRRLLVLSASLGWLLYSLDRFRLLRPLHGIGSSILQFGIEIGEVSIHIGDILVFLFASWLAFWAARIVRRLLRDELSGHAGLPRGVGNSISSLSYYSVLLLGILVALSAAGFKVSQLTLVFGALGVGIGFGLQTVVNNFVSGLVLMFERPIQPGDVVDAAGSSGTVREIGLRATTIRTFDGAEVIVPNGLLLSGNLTNWTMFDQNRRIEIAVGVAYGSDPSQVLTILNAAACTTPGVADQPAPTSMMTSYGDSALHFIVRAWTTDITTWASVRGELLARALAGLQAAGISIPYNQMDLHVRTLPEHMQSRMEKEPPIDGNA